MPGDPKKDLYNKGLNEDVDSNHTSRLLEKEDLGIILVFTAIVMAALLLTYII